MTRYWTALVLTLISLLGFCSPSPAARLAIELEAQVLAAEPDEKLPVLVILRRQADPWSLQLQTRGMLPDERRSFTQRALRALAGTSQQEVLQLLTAAAEAGEADPPHPFWLLNAVRTAATPDVIRRLEDLPSVDRILWDPEIPVEQQTDAGPSSDPGRGKRALREDPEVAWQLTAVNAPEAWAQGYDGTGVLVGVVDTGVDYTHPDLADHIWVNEDEIPDNEVDDDENGYVDDVLGWDFVGEDNDPMGTGPGDHGTRVAGIVAGDGTSGIVTGVAPGATIMPLRGSGSTWAVLIEALEYAVANGVDVISMSISQKWRYNPKPDFAAWRTLMDNELAAGVFHANSIGNEGDNPDTDPVPFNVAAPGNCPAPWVSPEQFLVGGVSAVIGVGAVTPEDYVADFSSRGPSAWEDIGLKWNDYPYEMPPEYQDYPYSSDHFGLIKPDICGVSPDCVTTEFGGGYSILGGTSAATPQVGGAMAVLLQAMPDMTPEVMAQILMGSAHDLGPAGKDNAFGAGKLDVGGAVDMALNWANVSLISGRVFHSVTLDTIPGATVKLREAGPQSLREETRSRSDGSFLFLTEAGDYELVTQSFYTFADTALISAPGGHTVVPDILLSPRDSVLAMGVVTDAESADSLALVRISLPGTPVAAVETDSAGAYAIAGLPKGRTVTLHVVRFGHVPQALPVVLDSDTVVVDVPMPPGLEETFAFDQGWTVGRDSDSATYGIWERCAPVGTYEGEIVVQPASDASEDPETLAFITGNNLPGAGTDWNDVDDGRTSLLSPVFDGTRWGNPMLQAQTWYSNDTGTYTDDTFSILVSSDGGETWVTLQVYGESHREWLYGQWDLANHVEITDQMQLCFEADDSGDYSTVEAGVDELRIVESTTDVDDRLRVTRLSLSAYPTPFTHRSRLALMMPRAGRASLEIYNVEGRRVRRIWDGNLDAGLHTFVWDGRTDGGRRAASGVYFVRLAQASQERRHRLVLVK
ncbi:MAG: S8 family serine peptidase [Candidatus Eisenbacteria bacterium]|nr:S8 family serine peptidase [Candidatus Eisenbacteria bacterium]